MEDLFAKIPEGAPIRNLQEKFVEVDGKLRTAFVPPSMDKETMNELFSEPNLRDFFKNG